MVHKPFRLPIVSPTSRTTRWRFGRYRESAWLADSKHRARSYTGRQLVYIHRCRYHHLSRPARTASSDCIGSHPRIKCKLYTGIPTRDIVNVDEGCWWRLCTGGRHHDYKKHNTVKQMYLWKERCNKEYATRGTMHGPIGKRSVTR